MNQVKLRKRLSYIWKRCYYPRPEPLAHGRKFWIAMGAVFIAFVSFSVFFTEYMFALQNTFQTNAEDTGIVDQALWNTVHGRVLWQTICNNISDTNCGTIDGISRMAIHFEPIMFLVSLFYLIWANPKTLFIVQSVIVATGAFPAFWLARLRLRSEIAGVGVALMFLLYPSVEVATTFDFHAVALTASFLLFTFYFLYARRTVWMFVFAILSMACKEEIPAVIAIVGIWCIIFQRRYRVGLALTVLAGFWLILGLRVVMPLASPIGKPMLTSRYDFGNLASLFIHHPSIFLHTYLLEPFHRLYLHRILAPAGFIPGLQMRFLTYIPFLAPWILVFSLPSLAINMLSSNNQMYSGFFHYDAEIVPSIIFATIEAWVLILWVSRHVAAWLARWRASALDPETLSKRAVRLWSILRPVLLLCLVVWGAASAYYEDYQWNWNAPWSQAYHWPTVSPHEKLAYKFISLIPSDASVSAQSHLAPHISERQYIYLFPYADSDADYIFLDTTSNVVYPYSDQTSYLAEVKRVANDGLYSTVASQDGYILLKRLQPSTHIAQQSSISTKQSHRLVFTSLGAFYSFWVTHGRNQGYLLASFVNQHVTLPKGLVHMSVTILPIIHTSSTITSMQTRLS